MAYVFNPFTGKLDTTDVVAFNGEVNAGTEGSPSLFFTGDPNTGIYSPGADQLAISTGGTGRLFVDSTGNVGIGTTNPTNHLTIVDDTGISIALVRTGASASTCRLLNTSNVLQIDNNVTGIIFATGTTPTEKARIDSSGRLLVGTNNNSGGALLQVNGDRVRVATAKTPASASDTGTTGEICWDADYVYVCVATNSWKRTAIAVW